MKKTFWLLLLVGTIASAQSLTLGGTVTLGGTITMGTASTGGGGSGCGSGYSTAIPLILLKASNTDQTNFPIPFSGRDYRLATSANGGSVQNTAANAFGITTAADFVVCPDNTLTGTALKHYCSKYNPANGDFSCEFQMPTYHTATNDTPYLYVGNSSVTTSQEDASLLGDAHYVVALDFPDGTTLNLTDFVSGSTATTSGTVGADFGAQDGGAYVGRTNGGTNYVDLADNAGQRPASAVTYKAYINIFPVAAGSNPIISKPYRTTASWSSPFVADLLTMGVSSGGGGQVTMYVTTGGVLSFAQSTGQIAPYTWTMVSGTYDGSNIKTWLNGVNDGSTAKSGSIDYNGVTSHMVFGTDTSTTNPGDAFHGFLDRIRQADRAESADWQLTDAKTGTPYKSNFVFNDSTYSKPQIRQRTSCISTSADATCVTNFSITSGGVLSVVASILNPSTIVSCPSMSNDSLGNTFTLKASSVYSGTGNNYLSCIYTAPVTSSGSVDTLTIPGNSGSVSAWVYETKGTTVTGLTSDTASGSLQPHTMTASCSGGDCLLICGSPYLADTLTFGVSTTPSDYKIEIGPADGATTHNQDIVAAYGIVAAGSNSCSFGGSQGRGGVMVILPKL